MTPGEEYRAALLKLYELYKGLIELQIALPGGAPQHLWDQLQRIMRDVMIWADIIAGAKIRYRATRDGLRHPDPHWRSPDAYIEANAWLAEHVIRSRPLIHWRAEKLADIEQTYLVGKLARAEQLRQSIPAPKVIQMSRLERFRRDAIGELANVSEQIQLDVPEIGDAFPFTELVSRKDARVRPTHALADGFVARRLDPIWKVIRPLNGFRCRCYTIQRTQREAIRLGWMTPAGRFLVERKWPSEAARLAYEIGIPFHGAAYSAVPRTVARAMFPDPGWTGPKYVATATRRTVAA